MVKSKKQISDESKLIKGLVYGANYLARPLGDLAKSGLKLGHPYSALGFGLWDLITENVHSVKQSLANKVVKIGGTAYFGFLTLKNLIEFANGNYEGLQDFPFNLSMAYSLGNDLKELFNQS